MCVEKFKKEKEKRSTTAVEQKEMSCGENTVEVSGADGTEPAAREEEGR